MADAKPKAQFVAIGHQGLRLSSPDGRTWDNLQTGKEGEIYRAVAFGNQRIVAVGNYGGDNLLASSPDTISWKVQRINQGNTIRGLSFGNGRFMAVGGDAGAVGDSRPFLVTSTNGEDWSSLIPLSGKNTIRRLAFGNNTIVGVGDRGTRTASPDGKTWQLAPDVRAIDTLIDIAFGKGIFVGVGLNGLRMTSTNGLRWEARQLGEEGEHLNSIVWTGDRFVAVGLGATYTSPDGTNWKRTENQNAPLFMTHGSGCFLGANWKGRILRSDDAIDWKQVFRAPHHIEAITFLGSIE